MGHLPYLGRVCGCVCRVLDGIFSALARRESNPRWVGLFRGLAGGGKKGVLEILNY